MEHKLLWQYLVSSAGLPIHHRRSLDQYRYPTLRTTAARDDDQVLHKRTQPSIIESLSDDRIVKATKSQNPFGKYANTSTRLLAKTRGRSDSMKQGRRTHQVTNVRHEDRSKVLMVDQLWCWVADGGQWFSDLAAYGQIIHSLINLANQIIASRNGTHLLHTEGGARR